ncbi:MAG: hypothetical protein RBS77_05065 [Candidatus Moranbacteria bacterium]|nr:hypothetical protein [Candidatus Moranbacteria bacterium]
MTFAELGIEERPGKVRYSTICPQCSHLRKKKTDPCLTVNNEPDNRWYKCWNCGWSGNLDILDKYKKVQENSRMPKQLPEIYSQEVMEYWKRRGIDYRICVKEKIFEYPFGRDKRPVLGFPTYINLTLVNVKYLNIRWQEGSEGPKWWQMSKDHGTNIIPWGLQSFQFEEDKPKVVIWTEGEIDRLTWLSAGYKNVISEPQGAPSPDAKDFKDKFAYMKDPYFKSVMADVDMIIFSTDNDAPGKMLRNHLAVMFGREKCKYINYPVGYKDINEVWVGDAKKGLKALGQEGVDTCYQNISSFPVKGIIRPQDVRDELEMIASNGFVPGYGTGIPQIDDLFTLKRKQLSVWTGLPSVGKSVVVRWYLSEFVRHNMNENLKWAMFTPENRPVSREQAKLAEVWSGKSFKRGYNNSMSEELRSKTMRQIQKYFFFIAPNKLNFETWSGRVDSDKVNTMESLMQYLIYLKRTENIFGFVIDAWNKIEHEQPKSITETTFISKQLDALINFLDVYDLHCILIAHPTKIEKVGINYRMPCLYDIKGSSAWKEKADLGVILHRFIYKRRPHSEIPDDATEDDKVMIDINAPTILHVEKVRFEENGKMGKVKMKLETYNGGRFRVLDEVKTPPPAMVGKLNPAAKDDDEDEVFNGKVDSKLPF